MISVFNGQDETDGLIRNAGNQLANIAGHICFCSLLTRLKRTKELKKRSMNHLLKVLIFLYRDFLHVVLSAFQNKVLVIESWYCKCFVVYEGNAATQFQKF